MSLTDSDASTVAETRFDVSAAADAESLEAFLRPTASGTAALLVGIGVSFFFLGGNDAAEMAGAVARVMLVALGASFLLDMRLSLRNLVRVDLFALLGLYFLTLFEFLFNQEDFSQLAYPEPTATALTVVLLGFLGITIGRHIMRAEKVAMVFLQDVEIRPSTYLIVFFGCFFISVFYMFLAVGFDPFAWFDAIIAPRFTQPWQRGKLGGWAELLNELALFGLIVPALGGIIFSKRREFGMLTLILVGVVILLQFFIVIAPGTRNALAINMAGFMGGYFLNQKRLRFVQLGIWGAIGLLLFVYISDHMLDFRNIGLRNYFEQGLYRAEVRSSDFISYEGQAGFMGGKGYFVDYNLLTIHDLSQVFPDQYHYLGWNLYWVALTKPIPRALWSGKPEGLAVGIEESLGVEGMTLACTFVGEAMIAGGLPAVFLTALALGIFFAYWNRLGCANSSLFALLVYAAGFFAALITMRSLMFMTTMILPAVALIVFARLFLSGETTAPDPEEY